MSEIRRGGKGGQMLTGYECAGCGETFTHDNSATPSHCPTCAASPPAPEQAPRCVGEWLSGSGGHRMFGGCLKEATWVELEGGGALCDEHFEIWRKPAAPEQAPTGTVTREHREAILAMSGSILVGRPEVACQLLATREAAAAKVAYAKGLADAAVVPAEQQGGWVLISADNLPDTDVPVMLYHEARLWNPVCAGVLDMTDDSEGHGEPEWLLGNGVDMPLSAFTHYKLIGELPPHVGAEEPPPPVDSEPTTEREEP